MTCALLGLLLLANPEPAEQVVEPTPVPAELPPPVWELFFGTTSGLRVDKLNGGGGIMAGVNRKFLNFIRPELMVAMALYDGPFDYLIQIRIGTRFELPLESRWKPYGWLAFAHNHESGIDHVLMDPLASLFGLSEHGVHHRSGLELGMGLVYELPRVTWWQIATRLGGRLTFTQFFGDSGPPRYVDLLMTAGLAI